MGTVYNRGTRSKPNWWITWFDPLGKRQYAKIGPDREIARKALTKMEGDIVAGRYDLRDETAPTEKLAGLLRTWAEGRKTTHRSHKDNRLVVENHLIPAFGDLTPQEVTVTLVKDFIRRKRQEKLAPQTIRNILATLSVFYNDLLDDETKWGDVENPLARLGRRARKLIGPRYDPKKTSYLKSKEEIRNLYLALPELKTNAPWRAMYAVGVFAGLRTGEIQALRWADLDFDERQIHVQRSVAGPLKDDDSRFTPIVDSLLPVLREWKLMCRPGWLVFPPTVAGRGGRKGTPAVYVRAHSMHRHLRKALGAASLPAAMTWYQSTRHTFASHWLLDGGSLARLAEVLGHSMEQVSTRYGHLERRRQAQAEDLGKLRVDLRPRQENAARDLQDCYAGVTLASNDGSNGQKVS